MQALREEVRRISDQDNETALNLREAPDIRKLQQQSRSHTDDNANQQTAKEDDQEDADTLEETQDAVATSIALVVLLRRLEDDNGNGVVEDGFAKDDGVQLRVDFVGVENGENCDGIGSGQRCAY